MQSKKELILGALGFCVLAYLAFWGVSALVENQDDVTFEAPPDPSALLASLKGQVLAPDGEPPEDCVATLWLRVDGKLQTGPGRSGPCVDGELSYDDLQPGTYLLEVGVEGASRYARNIDLVEGDRQDLGVSQLSPGGVLEVQAVGPDGRGLPGARIWLGNWLVTSDVEGRFRFVGASAGELRVRAQFDGVVGSGNTTLEAAETKALEVEIKDLSLRGVLGLEFTAATEGLTITAVATEGPAHGVLESGDLIVASDGVPTLALPQSSAEQRLDGAPKTSIKLSVMRDGEPLEIELERADLLDVVAARMKAEPDTEKTEP